jgi:hypothetical protein
VPAGHCNLTGAGLCGGRWNIESKETRIQMDNDKKVARNKGRTSVRMNKETKKTLEKKSKLKMSYTVTNCTEQSSFCEANTSSASQDIPHILWTTPKIP